VFYFVHDIQTRRHATFFLDQARAAQAEGKPGEALNHYSTYLALAPQDHAARAEMGFMLADLGANQEAFQTFETVLRQDPERSDVRRRTVAVAMAIGRFRDAREHLEEHLLKEAPDDAELLELCGQCQAHAGQYVAAARSFESAIGRAPTRVLPYVRLASILSEHREDLAKDQEHWLACFPPEQRQALSEDKDWAERTAAYWTDRMVGSNPADTQAYVFRGYRRYSKRQFDGATEDAEKALKLKPDDPEALHLAAMSCLAAKQPERARKFARRGVEKVPKDSRMYVILAEIILAGEQPDKREQAIQCLRNGVTATGQPDLLWRLGRLLIATGNIAEAGKTVESLRKKDFPKVYADFLEAQIQYVQGRWLAASQGFGKLDPDVKSFPALAEQAFYCLGTSYEQLGDAERALAAYRQAVAAAPSSVPAREAVATSLQSLGRLDEALEEQRTLVKLKDAPLAAWAQLVRSCIRKNLRLAPAQRNWKEVEDVLEQAAQAAPKSALTPLLRAELLVAQDRGTEAEKLILAQRDKEPNEIVYWIALVDLALRDKQWDRAEQLLQEVEKKLGDRVPLRLARAYYLAQKAEKNAAAQLRPLAEKAKDFSPDDLAKLWRGLVGPSLLVEDFQQAAQLTQLLMAQAPNDLRVRMQLFEVAAQASDFPLMEKALGEVRRLEGSGPLWHYATAVRLSLPAKEGKDKERPDKASQATARQAVLEQALEHLAAARQSRPGWSRALMLEGVIYEELRQEGPALAKYLQAVEQGETSPEVVRRALQLLYRKGQYAAANTLLRRLEEQQVPFTTDLLRVQSSVLGRLQDFPGAVQAAQRVAAASQDYRDHLWLGQLQSILGRPSEAEKTLRHALSLDEQAPETWVALVRFLVRTEQKGPAAAALAQARVKIPAAQAPLALAECFEALGKPDEAGEQYAAALRQDPNDCRLVRRVALYHVGKGNLPEAARLFQRIAQGRLPATPEQVAEARGALARVMADEGGYPNLVAAVHLVEQNLAAAPASADDLRLKARLLAAHPGRHERQEAVQIFEKMVEDPASAVAEDYSRLAQLYLAGGDWTKARRQMVALLTGHGNQPRYVAAYVQALLDHNEFREAALWLDRLEQIAPDDPQAMQLRADVQFHAGKIDEVLATLVRFVEKAPAASRDRLARTLAAAAQLEVMGSRPGGTAGTPAAATVKENAELLYRKYVGQDPKQGLVLVDFLARQKRFDEALQLAEEAWKAAEPPRIAVSCEILLRQPGIKPSQVARLAGIVSAALEKNGRPAPLLLTMAQVQTEREKFPEAEAIYRELLRKDGKHVPALNNLAELLALSGRQLDEARTLIEQALALAGPEAILLDTRATVYMALGQTDRALVDLDEAVALAPRSTWCFHHALVCRKAGQAEEAARWLAKAQAMQLRPDMLNPLERPAYEELVRSQQ
jgi:tetratricopeptide (TPR) repeat protein